MAHEFEVAIDELSADELTEVIRPVTEPLRAHGPGSGTMYRIVFSGHDCLRYALYANAEQLVVTHNPDVVARRLAWHINMRMVATSVGTHVVLHAAAATRSGITVILPGVEESGKTTTVAGLLKEGYEYVTDEAVAIDPQSLQITPFPKALSFDPGTWPLFPACEPGTATAATRQWQVPPGHLGSRTARSANPPRVIVFPRFTGHGTTHQTPLGKAKALEQMALCTFRFRELPRRNLRTLAAVIDGATVVQLRISSLDHAVDVIEEVVSTSITKGLLHHG